MNKMQGNPATQALPRESLAGALERAARRLEGAGIPRARFEAGLLLARATGATRARLLADRARDLAAEEAAALEALVARRVAREPMAHILGGREFWSLDFGVTRDVLIPRPESETLIEAALAHARDRNAPLVVLDLGTGSGCLLLALLSELPRATGLGVDKSEVGCGIARDNGRRLGLGARAQFRVADWSDPNFGDEIRAAASHMRSDAAMTPASAGRFDLILANPPYVPDAAIDGLEPEVRDFEPHAALAGGPDGLVSYRTLAPCIAALLAPAGAACVEIGAGQARAVEAIFQAAGLVPQGARRDLAGIERCLAFAPARGAVSGRSGTISGD
jgi:release factor glutamine methyltransferase